MFAGVTLPHNNCLVPGEAGQLDGAAIRVVRKYGDRAIRGTAVASYGYGIAAGIAEQSLLNDKPL
jgi:hypothetical protein